MLNVQIREQQEVKLKSKIFILNITEERKKIEQQLDANSKAAQKINTLAL